MLATKATMLTSNITESELREVLEHALNCVLCFCGNHKRIGKPWCFQCFDSLPLGWRSFIPTTVITSENFAHHYSAGCEWLRAHYPRRFSA